MMDFKSDMRNNVKTQVTNVISDLILINLIGVNGAAVSNVLSELYCFYGYLTILRKREMIKFTNSNFSSNIWSLLKNGFFVQIRSTVGNFNYYYLNKQIFRSKCNIIFHYFVKNINICYVNNTELIFVYNEICSLNINETNFDKIIIINEKIIFSCITVNTKRLSTTNEFIPKDEPTCKCCFDDMNDEDSKDKTFLVLSCKHLICLDCAESIRNNQCIICRQYLYSSDDVSKYVSYK